MKILNYKKVLYKPICLNFDIQNNILLINGILLNYNFKLKKILFLK
jgi:hypothetical protein